MNGTNIYSGPKPWHELTKEEMRRLVAEAKKKQSQK